MRWNPQIKLFNVTLFWWESQSFLHVIYWNYDFFYMNFFSLILLTIILSINYPISTPKTFTLLLLTINPSVQVCTIPCDDGRGVEAPEPRAVSPSVGDLRRPGPGCTLITPASRDGRVWGGLLQWTVGPFTFSDDFKCIHLKRKNSIIFFFMCNDTILLYNFGVIVRCLRNLLFIYLWFELHIIDKTLCFT